MDFEEMKKLVLDAAKEKGVTLDENELDAKLLEMSKLDPDELENVNGGLCGQSWFQTCDVICVLFTH